MDDSPEEVNPRCTICSHVKSNHGAFRHPFSEPKNPISTSQVFGKPRTDRTGGSGRGPAMDQPQVSVQSFPFDPVLRQALIDKGVITPDDLLVAQSKIIVVNQMFQEAMHKDV